MHPLVAIGVVFLSGLAWMVTVLTLLIALAKDRRRPTTEVSRGDYAQAQATDVQAP